MNPTFAIKEGQHFSFLQQTLKPLNLFELLILPAEQRIKIYVGL
jgi:hypothetical protein